MKVVDILAAIGLMTVVKWGIKIALKVDDVAKNKNTTNDKNKTRG